MAGEKMKTGRRKRLNKLQRDNIIGYGLIAPSMILLIAIGIVPILITVSYSFQYRVLTDPLNTHFVGLENYVTLFTSSDFGQIFWNTAVFAVVSLIIQLIAGFDL